MLQMNRQQAVLEPVLLHPFFNFAREFQQPPTARRDALISWKAWRSIQSET